MATSDLEQEIKQLIIDSLSLEGVTVDDIDTDAPLFGEGLGLDSIDALELAMAVKKKYGVSTKSDDDKNHAIFASVKSLAQFVQEEKAKA